MKTINLLPKEQLRQLQFRSWYRHLRRFYVLSMCSFVLVGLVCLGVWWYLASVHSGLRAETELLQQFSAKQENTELRNEIKNINAQIADYNALAASQPQWSKVLRQFARLVPEGVQVQQFSVDSVRKLVTISGFAQNREGVVRLHDNVAADTEHFSNIDYPLENVARPTAISFHYSFTVQESLLQQSAQP